jgi:hypothetical protein
VELSVVEQRYQAVLAVIRDGVPIVEVARRFDVSRQAVHRWLRWISPFVPAYVAVAGSDATTMVVTVATATVKCRAKDLTDDPPRWRRHPSPCGLHMARLDRTWARQDLRWTAWRTLVMRAGHAATPGCGDGRGYLSYLPAWPALSLSVGSVPRARLSRRRARPAQRVPVRRLPAIRSCFKTPRNDS